MATTDTTQWFRISDGDITTHDIQAIASTAKRFAIQSAQIQWEGIETTSSGTNYSTNTNYDEATATSSTSTDSNTNSDSATATTSTTSDNNTNSDSATATSSTSTDSNTNSNSATATTSTTSDSSSNSDSATATTSTTSDSNTNSDSATATTSTTEHSNSTNWLDSSASATYPTISSFDHHEVKYYVSNTSSSEETVSITWDYADGSGSFTESVTVAANTDKEFRSASTSTYYGGESRTVTDESGLDHIEVSVAAETYEEVINNKTASTTYPSVPSGYTFDHHIREIFENGELVSSDTFTTNKVGETVSQTSDDPDVTYTVTLHTYGTETTINDKTATASFPSVPSGYEFSQHIEELSDNQGWSDTTTYTTNKVGESVSIDSSDPDRTVTVTLETYGTDTTINNKTASTTYPSIPSGYNFDYHERTYNYDDGTTDTTTFTTNKVGESESLTSSDPDGGVTVTLDTYGTETTINEKTATVTYPSVPSGYTFDYHEISYNYDDGTTNTSTTTTNRVGETESLTSSDPDGGVTVTLDTFGTDTIINEKTASTSYPSVPSGYNFDHHIRTLNDDEGNTSTTTYYDNKVGESESITSDDPNGGVSVTLDTVGEDTTVYSKTASTSYPSIPSGYSFDHHYEDKSDGTSNYYYTNKVGETESITSNSTSNTVWVELDTQGEDNWTNTHYTEDPNVTRDVSGDSGTTTLTDGETSSWYTLNGLDPNVEEFYHNIYGSGEAYFRFEFTWEEIFPDVQKQLRLYDAGENTLHKVALADPTDSNLHYNTVRVADNGTVYAVDMVDPSDSHAIDGTNIYHGTHGELALRAFDSVSI